MSDALPTDEFDSEKPGAELRKARERAGISFQQVADRTLIAPHKLEALERDDYDVVGGRAYATGYARAYARAIGVKPQPYIQALESIFTRADPLLREGESVQAGAVRRERMNHKSMLPAVLASLLIAALLGWFLTSQNDPEAPADNGAGVGSMVIEPATDPVNPGPDLAAPQPEAATEESTADPPVTSDSVPVDPAVADIAPSVVEGAGSTAEPPTTPSVVEPDVIVAPEAVPEPQLDQLDIAVSEDCWVEVVDATGQRLIARTAQSGDNLQLFGQAPFQITLGNASAASVQLNGEVVPVQPRPGRKVVRLRAGD